MAMHAANGMLHLSTRRIIHRDVALRNLLVVETKSGYNVKITDFGLSRSVQLSYYKNDENSLFPIKWSAPEIFEYGTYLLKSDVYSFGILLWEMFSYGRSPYPFYTNVAARKAILEGEVLPIPEDCPPKMYELMRQCWTFKSEERPTFMDVYQFIHRFWRSSNNDHQRSTLMSNSFYSNPNTT